MHIEKIEGYIRKQIKRHATVNIHFKGRPKVTGLFIFTRDYHELKLKNFWRVVDVTRVEQWKKTKDITLARIFNGASFSTLTGVKS